MGTAYRLGIRDTVTGIGDLKTVDRHPLLGVPGRVGVLGDVLTASLAVVSTSSVSATANPSCSNQARSPRRISEGAAGSASTLPRDTAVPRTVCIAGQFNPTAGPSAPRIGRHGVAEGSIPGSEVWVTGPRETDS